MSRLRTRRPDSSAAAQSAGAALPPSWTGAPGPTGSPGPQRTPPEANRRTTWMLLAIWIGVMFAIYLVTEVYRKPSDGKVMAHGVLEIPRDRDGHFRVAGSVNGVPVQFMVDTGASLISITDAVAERANLGEGVPISFQTANGVRQGMMSRAERIEVGPLAVNGLRVGTGYTGESARDALLGQNFLRYFDVSISGNSMVLKARGGE
ncbi:retropepsin-like aspartic protease [Comamonas sp.]|uniref:retropepsin-like aspartic protease family protein n=1 Tax=Comamonas sp. TaxID=34028 RepID=UPI00289E644A|nr:retropepsin-like aspartic protease [Comamonas sp.]